MIIDVKQERVGSRIELQSIGHPAEDFQNYTRQTFNEK